MNVNKIFYLSRALVFPLCFFSADQASAQSYVKKQFQPFLTRGESTWSASVGARRNNFDWNIANDLSGTATPNILSELTWEDVTLLEFKGEVRHDEPLDIGFINGDLHLEAGATGGLTVSGDNQDSDFAGDNRTQEFSRSNNSADEGSAIGINAAIGYKIRLTGDPSWEVRRIARTPEPRTARGRARKAAAMRQALANAGPAISLTPLAGYAWNQQIYRMTDGNQTIPASGPFGGLDSEYMAEWHGPFAGLEAEIAGQKNRLRVRGEYHDLNYYGEAIWNLRTTFQQDPSFIHEADGTGYLISGQYAYALSPNYALTVDGAYQIREAEDGIDTTYLNTGAGTVSTRLNEVNDESYSLRFGMRYDW